MAQINGKTTAPVYGVESGNAGNYNYVPLLTVGDRVALLEGDFGNFTTSNTQTYAMAGIPDGLGYVEINGIKYVFMNHELSGGTLEVDAAGQRVDPGVTTDIQTSQGQGEIRGARVSLWAFDENWNAIGGKNLIEDVLVDGVTYSLNTTTGNYQDASGNVLTWFNHENFTRFCSGYLAAQGFVDAQGNAIPIWFAPQERSDGVGTPVQANGLATPVKGLGTLSKENVVAASQYRAANSEYTVLLATEDRGNGELYLYVGRQTPDNPNGFWSSVADGANFELYVLQVVDAAGNVYGYETMPENVKLQTRWTLVPDAIAVNPNPEPLSNFADAGPANQILGNFNSTNFRRLEDIHEDPNKPGTFYFVTTGRNDEVPVDTYSQPNPLAGLDTPAQGPTTKRDNALGKLHRLNVSIDANGVPQPGTFETLLEGGRNKGVSYDNIVVDTNGNVIIQEDETADGDVIMDAENRDGSILKYNIAANEGVVGNDRVEFIFELNQAAEGQQFVGGTGDWESSGVVEVGSQAGRSSYLFDVQAHTISPFNEDLTPAQQQQAATLLDGNYNQGGQLILALPQQELVFGTTNNDTVEGAGIPGTIETDGTSDLIFTGAGADLVDVSSASPIAEGANRVYSGSGNDEGLASKNDRLFGGQGSDTLDGTVGEGMNRFYGGDGNDEIVVKTKDRAFGGLGNDTLEATNSEGMNRLYGNEGNDDFFLGRGDRVVGGEGVDRFFAGTGGNNTITGGAGADQFWVVNAQLPNAANTITDLTIGEDVIGIAGFTQAQVAITNSQGNALLSVAGTEVATFLGVTQQQLQAALAADTFVFVAAAPV